MSSTQPIQPDPTRRSPRPETAKYRSILESAEAIFGARGYKRAAVDEIALAAGVSKPLIYRYFKSKEHLFEVVVDRVISEWCDVIQVEGARITPTAAHSLRLIVRASLTFAGDRRVLRGLLARESQLMLAGYSDVLERGTETLRRVLVAALERGVTDGDVRTDVDLHRMADVMTEVCVGFGDRLLAGEVPEAGSELLDAIIESLLYGVVVQKGRLEN